MARKENGINPHAGRAWVKWNGRAARILAIHGEAHVMSRVAGRSEEDEMHTSSRLIAEMITDGIRAIRERIVKGREIWGLHPGSKCDEWLWLAFGDAG